MKIKQMAELLNSVPVRKKAKRLLAMTLAVLVVNPVTGYGVTVHAQETETITTFAKLPSEITTQQLVVGEEESDINLPDTLGVTVVVSSADTVESIMEDSHPQEIPTEEVKPDESTSEKLGAEESATDDSNVSGSDEKEVQNDKNGAALDDVDTEPAETEKITSEERTLTGITWQINTECSGSNTFDSSNADQVFIYEPILPEGYILADGVSMPQIVVTVVAFPTRLALLRSPVASDASGGLDLSKVQTTTSYTTTGGGTINWEPTLDEYDSIIAYKLTLNNVTINSANSYGIQLPDGDITIEVSGTNNIKSMAGGGAGIVGYYPAITLTGDGNLTVDGAGQLGIDTQDLFTLGEGFTGTLNGLVWSKHPTLEAVKSTIYGNVTATGNLNVQSRFEVAEAASLTVPNDVDLNLSYCNDQIENNGTILNNGNIVLPVPSALDTDIVQQILALKLTGSGTLAIGSDSYLNDGTVLGDIVTQTGLDLTRDKPAEGTVYKAGEGTITFTPAKGEIPDMLTLNNATIESSGIPLKLDTKTVLMLVGTNILTDTRGTRGTGISTNSDVPIIIEGNSQASLTVNAYQCTNVSALTISGATVTMNGSTYGIVASGDVLLTNGAKVTAVGGEDGDALQVDRESMGSLGEPPSTFPSLTVQGNSSLTLNGGAMISGGLQVGSESTITISAGNRFNVLASNNSPIANSGTIDNNGTVLLPFTLTAAQVNALSIGGEVILIDPNDTSTPCKEYIYVGEKRYLRVELKSTLGKLDLSKGLPEEATYYKLESGGPYCYILFTPVKGSETPMLTLHDVNNTGFLMYGIELPDNSIILHVEGVNIISSIVGDGNITIEGSGRLDSKIIRSHNTATLTIAEGITANVLHELGKSTEDVTDTIYGSYSKSIRVDTNRKLILTPGAVLTLEATYKQKLSFDENTALSTHLEIGEGAKIVNNSMVILPQGTTAEQIKALPLSGTGLIMVPTAYGDKGEPTAGDTYRNDGTTINQIDGLDVTTGDHSGKTVEKDGYGWNASTNTLTLGDVALTGEIKLPATVIIHTIATSTIMGNLQAPIGETLHLTLSGTAPLDIMGKIRGRADGDTLTVQGGAKITAGRISIGGSGGSNGVLNVKGAGTSLTVSEQYSSAVYCQTINVTDGATLTASSEQGVGVMAMSGNVAVTGGSTLTTNCEYGVYIINGKLTVDATSKLITNGTVAPFCVVDKTSGKPQNDVLALAGTPIGTEIASVTGTLANYWSLVPTGKSLSVSNETSEPVNLLGAKTGELTFVKASSGGDNSGGNNSNGGSSSGGDNSGGNNNNGGSSSGSSSSYDYYEIKLSKEGNGTISPDGGYDNTLSICKGTDQTFTFTPDKGYQVSDVLVDGKNIGAKSSYTFEDVTKDHILQVIFQENDVHENPQTGLTFKDITEKDWFYVSVVNAVGKGWFEGTSDTTFSPYLSTTRGMIATVLWRMEQTPNFSSATIFRDVLQGKWYYVGVTWAQENDIVKGYGNGKFGPNDNITREQLASILYRYAQFKGLDVSQTASLDGFSDGNKVSAYATETMKWAVGANLISGKGNGILDPSGEATRAEVAAILTRFHTLIGSK